MRHTHRQLDTWVIDLYVDEAGWDGQREQIYFTRKQDAEFVLATILSEAKTRKDRQGDRVSIDYRIYKLAPYGSFYQQDQELAKMARQIALETLSGLE